MKNQKEELPFKSDIIIKRESLGVVLPAGMTDACSVLLKYANDSFGHLIKENVELKDFSKMIREHSSSTKAQYLANGLDRVESLTLVMFSGDNRDSTKTDYKYNVIGCDLDEAEDLIDQIFENEIKKKKYADSKPRRSSVYTSAGGELKSGVVIQEPKIEKKSTIKNT
jgi:hypothetical protein